MSDFYGESNALYPKVLKGLLLCAVEDAGFTRFKSRARAVQLWGCFLKYLGVGN